MSVIYYDDNELIAMLAASWNHGSIGSLDAKRRLQTYADAGMRIAHANRQAYAETYNELVESANITARDVELGIVGLTGESMKRGKRVLDGIRYNIVANNGKDFATFELLDDLLMLCKAHMKRMY